MNPEPHPNPEPRQSTPEIAVRVKGLTFSRGDRCILENVSLDFPVGSIVAVMGPSGVGKSTLLNLVTGQLTPDAGSVEVFGQCVSTMQHRALYQYRRRIGVMLQNGALFTDLSVFDNVALPIREHTELSETLTRRLVLSKLQAVGLRGAADLMPAELSGGMARRVALARAIVLDPELMLYDEPMTGLDPISLATVMQVIRELNRWLGITSIIVTHDVQEMSRLADYCYIIADRRVIAGGTPAELERNDSPAVRQFMAGLPDGPVPFHYPAPALDEALVGPAPA